VSWDKFGAQLMPPAFIRQIFLTDLMIEVGWAERGAQASLPANLRLEVP